MNTRFHIYASILVVGATAAQSAAGANWSVAPAGTVTLDTSTVGFAVSEMSGVTYVGPAATPGLHRFLTVQDDGTGVVAFDAAFDLSGNLLSADAVSQLALAPSLDQEGIAIVDDLLYVSDEDGPGVRQHDWTTGNQLQNVDIPAVFANRRNNRGFESLAYDATSSTLWTANEEALTVDGALATSSAGTTVRLLELAVDGNSATAGRQFAYAVEPIHGFAFGSARSGLAELVAMPDGALLALERSAAVASPLILHRMYEIGFDGATDVSGSAFDAGLAGQSVDAVTKELLWSGGINGSDNMEGLTVGPRLPNGDWIMLGVVDNGGSDSNTIVSFVATSAIPLAMEANNADFDADGSVDGDDFLAWQAGRGVTTLAGVSHGDANHDGTVTAADLAIWGTQYSAVSVVAVPEPSALALFLGGALLSGRRGDANCGQTRPRDARA